MRPHPHRLPGPLREQAGGDQAAHRVLQRVVIPLVLGPGVLRPRWRGQRVQYRGDDRRALRRQIPEITPAPPNVVSTRTWRSSKFGSRSVVVLGSGRDRA